MRMKTLSSCLRWENVRVVRERENVKESGLRSAAFLSELLN